MNISMFSGGWPGEPLDIDDLPQDRLEKLLYLAVETRRFEIERFWQRSLFFWGFIAAAFVGYAALSKDEQWKAATLLGCFGFVASVAWTLQNRGAKYWQEAWEQKVEGLEFALWGTKLFGSMEPVQRAGWFGASRYSVSRLAIMLSDFTVLIWLGMIFRLVRWTPDVRSGDWWLAFALIGTMLFCLMMLRVGRSRRRD
jgi:hypothetical protein